MTTFTNGGDGTYQITGNTIELRYANGARALLSFFVAPESANERPPELIFLDGNPFRRQSRAAFIAPPIGNDPATGSTNSSAQLRSAHAAPTKLSSIRPPRPIVFYDDRLDHDQRGRLIGGLKNPEPELRMQIQRLPYVASFHTWLAYDLLFKQRFQECLDESRAALRLDSDEKWAYVYAGEALRHLGQLKSSEAEFREAIRLDPNVGGFHILAGLALVDLGQFESSEAEFREAIRVDWIDRISENSEQLNRKPPEADYYFYLALALAQEGRVSEARSKLHKAMELSHARMEYIEDLEQKLGGR